MKELKPCPFCGGKIEKVSAPMMNTVMFVCHKCGADVCFSDEEFIKKAISIGLIEDVNNDDSNEEDEF